MDKVKSHFTIPLEQALFCHRHTAPVFGWPLPWRGRSAWTVEGRWLLQLCQGAAAKVSVAGRRRERGRGRVRGSHNCWSCEIHGKAGQGEAKVVPISPHRARGSFRHVPLYSWHSTTALLASPGWWVSLPSWREGPLHRCRWSRIESAHTPGSPLGRPWSGWDNPLCCLGTLREGKGRRRNVVTIKRRTWWRWKWKWKLKI